MRGETKAAADPGPGVVGRAAELALLQSFLGADGSRRALVLTGGPGVGKTTLWDAAVEAARRHGRRVLSARPSDAEAQLAFTGLIDLFDGVGSGELAGLPEPQLHALEVALLRATPTGPTPEANAIAIGLLTALRALAARNPLLVAVDDPQWLDPSSAAALAFAARRLEGDEIAFLLARRPGSPPPLEHALGQEGIERLEIGPLSIDATRRLLVERLGLALPRELLRRLHDATVGNPLFALEVGRRLAEEGLPAIGEDLPVPGQVEDLLGTRVAELPDAVRRLLLAAALSPDLRAGQLAGLAEPGTLDDAAEAGVLVVDGDHVRPSHPLLAAAATHGARETELRELHQLLAGAVDEGELRTRHLALAAVRPDAVLAEKVASAAEDAARRGAAQAAVELAEHALRLTAGGADRSVRVLALAAYLEVAGERQRLTDLLVPALESLPSGAPRVRACLLLTGGVVAGNDDIQRYLHRALVESGDDAQLRASVLTEMSANSAGIRVEAIREAEAMALEAVTTMRRAGPERERPALYALAWARSLGGHAIDEVCDRFRAVSDAAHYIAESPERVAGQRLVWRGELSEARAALTRLLSAADERGEPSSYALQRLHVCELELRAGAWEDAARLLDEWAESADQELLLWPMYERCRALLAAGRGLPDDARRWAAEAIARATATGVRWDELEALRALGIAALLAREPDDAAGKLRAVWAHTEREGVDDPGAFPVAPDLVEALAELGELDEARLVTRRLGELAERQEHPWGRATARRCAAVTSLAESYDEQAVADLEQAASEYASLGLAFDRARSLLSLGRVQRRFRKWGRARDTLQQALGVFDEIGSVGWVAETRSELARVGARRSPPAGELTTAERRTAELAAQGLANKEIAQALVVTVNTVEYHLSKAYAKLGIRSRAQLAARLAAAERPEDSG